ncbi:MAG: cobalamin-dependent protein [Chloroflexi bacterium]|nr:cobalamin-dependent protein [Chloroflexota bacterium]
MNSFTNWRGFDLSPRIAKIQSAFNRTPIASADQVPILVNTPCYFSFGSQDKPVDYYTNPASMFAYQANGYEKHLQLVNDDYVPYFMPWFGTGILASGFGARIRVPDDPADDPAVAEPCIKSPSDIALLKLPDPNRDGWMPRVLDAIDFAVSNGDLPVGLTDMQGPLDTIGLMCGQAQLYKWMYSEPRMVHDLFDMVTDAFILWTKIQKEHIGEPLERSNGLQGVFSPGCGVWESDDDLVLIGSDLYYEFVVPSVSRIFETFGGGSVHYCGNGGQNIDNLKQIKSLRVINNSPLGKFEAFTHLVKSMDHQVTIQIQDASPVDVAGYYAHLFADLDDFRGIMLATFVMDNTGMDNQGGYIPANWDPYNTANRVVDSVRANIAKRLSGEPTLQKEDMLVSVKVNKLEKKEPKKSLLSTAQAAIIEQIRQNLIEFDASGVQASVHSALDAGIGTLDIILGMAYGMDEVGKMYEKGDFFLPELIMAGSTMAAGMAVLQPLLAGEEGAGGGSLGKVVLGTVKGDLHDIGKNLVRMMLEGARFEVIDLGVDVPPQKFVEALKEHDAHLLALSALLTTTLKGMDDTIKALKAAGMREQVRVMIGGAPISKEFADQIGADGYAPSAVQAVGVAKRLIGIEE